ncbi:MAG: hypothetical protein OK454_08205, partial [Thaumarchaeota archaeon]|nr:hypothetical protein [Nitrososphaerota archaeon]
MGDTEGEPSVFSKGDDIQAWKRTLKDGEIGGGSSEPTGSNDAAAPPSDGLDDIQRFRLRMKEEQEKQNKEISLPETSSALLSPPPGLSGARPDTVSTLLPPVEVATREEVAQAVLSLNNDQLFNTPPARNEGPSTSHVESSSSAGINFSNQTAQTPLAVAGIGGDYEHRPSVSRFASAFQNAASSENSGIQHTISSNVNGPISPGLSTSNGGL